MRLLEQGVAVASNRSRETAYGDLVAGLLDLRNDAATQRFDAELSAAQEDGRLDPQTARVLRWWQRESMRALVEHARHVVPPTLTALEEAASETGDEVQVADASWRRASGDDVETADNRTPQAPPTKVPPPADLNEHRRRLLVAGLTPLNRD